MAKTSIAFCKICERPYFVAHKKDEWLRLCKMVDGELIAIPLCEDCTEKLKYQLGTMRNIALAQMAMEDAIDA